MLTHRSAAAVVCAATCAAVVAPAGAQSVLVDCAGAGISSTGSTPDVVRTSTATIPAGPGYQFAFNPIVTGSGLAGGSFFGSMQPLAFGLNNISIGGQRVLFGAVRNPTSTLPTRLDFYKVTQVVSGFTVGFDLDHQILADGRCQAAIRNIQRPFLSVGLTINSGGLLVTAWNPPAPAVSEWHFDGDLLSVKQSGLAPASGPAKVRYLDDAAFGPILGGAGNLDNPPASPTPTGVTQAQGAFGTTTSFGIPSIGTEEDTVWRTSPPRNAGSPTSSDHSRGLGLSLFPNTRDYWPEERNGQWTMVWDLYIPSASWTAALADSADGNVCIPLVEDSSNNNSGCDMFVRASGAGAGSGSVGYTQTRSSAIAAPGVAPDQWFRLAVSVDHYGKAQSRVFVNGVFVGVTGSSWLYNACKSSAPTWGDASPANPAATPVPGATWTAWGEHPSPWAKSATATPAPMSSTLSLFADLLGNGHSVYVANMLFTDEAMSDAQVSALGGPNARGIVHLRPPVVPPCAADFNAMDGLTVQDIFDFLNAWFAGQPSADFNGGGLSVNDIFDFLNAWFAGC